MIDGNYSYMIAQLTALKVSNTLVHQMINCALKLFNKV